VRGHLVQAFRNGGVGSHFVRGESALAVPGSRKNSSRNIVVKRRRDV
jgi:hypothetical protein